MQAQIYFKYPRLLFNWVYFKKTRALPFVQEVHTHGLDTYLFEPIRDEVHIYSLST